MSDFEKVVIMRLETGVLWPFYNNQKALSSNTLTKLLKELEYKEVPFYVLQKAAENGKLFHEAIQNFFANKQKKNQRKKNDEKLNKLEIKIEETLKFLESARLKNFKEVEKLHYTFYKGRLLATYVDLEFEDFIVELKSNNFQTNSPITFLAFEMQMLIQQLCTKKEVYLLWSTGQGVIYKKFKITSYALRIFDMVIELINKDKELNVETKQKIAKRIMNNYLPFDVEITKMLN